MKNKITDISKILDKNNIPDKYKEDKSCYNLYLIQMALLRDLPIDNTEYKLDLPPFKKYRFLAELVSIKIIIFLIDTLIIETLEWRLHYIGINRKKFSYDEDGSILTSIYVTLAKIIGKITWRLDDIQCILGITPKY